LKINENKETLLYVRDEKNDLNMKFLNGEEFYRFNRFDRIVTVECNGNYLAIVMNEAVGDTPYPVHFILIKVIKKKNEDEVLMLSLREKLHKSFFHGGIKLKFHENDPLKLLLCNFTDIVTCDINTLKLSSRLEVEGWDKF